MKCSPEERKNVSEENIAEHVEKIPQNLLEKRIEEIISLPNGDCLQFFSKW